MANPKLLKIQSSTTRLEAKAQLPSSFANPFPAGDLYIDYIRLTNDTAGDVTVRITDNLGSPIPIVSDQATLMAGQTWTLELSQGEFQKNGIQWKASTATGVYAVVRGYRSA